MTAAIAAPDALFPLSEAADRLRVAKHTLRQWCLAGKVSYVRLGGQIMLLQSDLDSFVMASRVPAAK
jgi:excisionase family DNA binding protein